MREGSQLAGVTVLVTGATGGIGSHTARKLAELGATVLVHGRDGGRVRDVCREVAGVAVNEPLGFVRDLSSIAGARGLVADLAAKAPTIDVLINNAALGPGPKGGRRELSPDGIELRLAVNLIAPIVLTCGWLEVAKQPPRSIVNVSSIGQAPLDFGDLMLERGYSGMRAYRQSKLALIMWTFDLAEAMPGVAVNALHPGTLLDTKMVREAFGHGMGAPADGSLAVVGVVERSLQGYATGQYFDVDRPARPEPQALQPEARAALRAAVEHLCGCYLPRK